MSCMVFKFVSSERYEVLQALIRHYAGDDGYLIQDSAPTKPETFNEDNWPTEVSDQFDLYAGENYQWYEWFTGHDPSTQEFARDVQCLARIKNLTPIACQAHTVTFIYSYPGVPWLSDGSDNMDDYYRNYQVTPDDLHLQETVRCAVTLASNSSHRIHDDTGTPSESETNHSVEIWHRVMLAMVYSVPFMVLTHHFFSPQLNITAKTVIGICLIGLMALAVLTLKPRAKKLKSA